MCVICLADYLDCSADDLLVKIEEFKEQNCTLFSNLSRHATNKKRVIKQPS